MPFCVRAVYLQECSINTCAKSRAREAPDQSNVATTHTPTNDDEGPVDTPVQRTVRHFSFR